MRLTDGPVPKWQPVRDDPTAYVYGPPTWHELRRLLVPGIVLAGIVFVVLVCALSSGPVPK